MQRKRGGGGSPASFDSKELFVRFVFVCDFNQKKKKKGRDLSSSQVFSSNRESIDVSRFVAIAKHDAIFFFVEERREGVIAVIHRFFTVNNFTGGGASVSMSGNKKKRRKKTCKDSRGSNVTRKPRIAGGGGSPSWPKITFLPTPRNYHCVVPQ